MQALLQQVGSFTNGLADDDKVIGELITNMNDLLGSLDDRDTELRTTISSFRNLVSGLAKDRDPIATSVTGIDAMTAQLSDLFTRVRGPFKSTVISVQRLAQLLNTNTTTLQKVIDQLPEAYRLLDRVGSHGNFFNFYLCSAQVQISGPNGKPIKTPVVRSQVKRCNA